MAWLTHRQNRQRIDPRQSSTGRILSGSTVVRQSCFSTLASSVEVHIAFSYQEFIDSKL
jgi:hypothetical protein